MERFIPLIVVGIVVAIYLAFEDAAQKRRIRQMLEENDRMWNDLVNKHQKTIAESFQEGKPVTFTIERD